MRILIDALGAAEKSGGMKTYAENVVIEWQCNYPNDELIVVGSRWLKSHITGSSRFVLWPSENALMRALGQLLIVPAVRVVGGPIRLVALSPVLSPLTPRRRTTVVVHDWRHLRRPNEVSRLQHLYRRIWSWSVRRAENVIAITEKTRTETLDVSHRTVHVVSNGGDHPKRWAKTSKSDLQEQRYLLTYGHAPNKRPHLVIEALSHLEDPTVKLIVLSARGQEADRLRSIAASQGVADRVVLPGFVGQADYASLLSKAHCVVVASSDEGFGLPIVEAGYFNTPCVVTSDSGLQPIHVKSSVTFCDASPTALAGAIQEATARTSPTSVDLPLWSSCVEGIRNVAK